jgi:hypothetical protein
MFNQRSKGDYYENNGYRNRLRRFGDGACFAEIGHKVIARTAMLPRSILKKENDL